MITSKILVIDFDYIMHDCIRLYDSYVPSKDTDPVNWDKLTEELGISEFLSYNARDLQALTHLMLKNKNASFYAVDSHTKIIDNISDKIKRIRDMDDFLLHVDDERASIELVDIDYHYNLAYEGIPEITEVNDSNWAGYLLKSDMIDKYTWINTPTSNVDQGHINTFDDKVSVYDISMLTELAYNDDKYNDFSAIFFCRSENHVPYKYMHLYDLLVMIMTQVKVMNDGET